MKRALFFLLVPMLAFAGRQEAREYQAAYREHTEELVIHNGFATALILRGTLLDAEYRTAMATERRRLLDPTPENHASFVSRSDRDLESFHEVVFSADSAMPGRAKFGPGDDRWNVRLSANGTDEELVTVYQVRNPTPLHRALYPHINPWSDLWIARFRRTVQQPSEVVFHVGSGYGHGDLTFSDED